MGATRPLIFVLSNSIFLVGCASSAITSFEKTSKNLTRLVTTNGPKTDDSLQATEGATPGESLIHSLVPSPESSWQLGTPDLIVKLPTAYTLPPQDTDAFRNFVIPDVVASDHHINALELRLNNQDVVHHAEIRLDESDSSWRRDQQESGSGFNGMVGPTAHNPDGHFVNWVPGKQASKLPEGLAWRLPAKADLVVQLHMMPAESQTIIDPQIGLYFSEENLGLSPQMIWLGSRWLPIGAGDPSFKISDSYELPVDVDVLGVMPHCHYTCTNVKAWATLQDGSQRELVQIEKWDFNNQQELRFEPAISLPRGTLLSMEFSYDNSAENKLNPNDPPQDIEFGPLSSNEMADVWIQLMPKNAEERTDLKRSSAQHMQQKIIEGQENLVALEPEFENHIALAESYDRANEFSKQVIQLQQALKLSPLNLAVRENLAIALTNSGRHEEALVEWRRHIQLAPNNSQARVNLATALVFSNEMEEAESHLKRATELDANFGLAFFRLGSVQYSLGRFDDALESFHAALALDVDEPVALLAVARLLLTRPDSDKQNALEALALATQALELFSTPDAMSLSTLAMAQAATGDFELATTTAGQALARITYNRDRLLRPIVQRQIDHYQQGLIDVTEFAGRKPFISPDKR